MDDEHMKQRQAEKDEAVADVWAAIMALEAERRQPDLWERLCLVYALGDLFSGRYSAAMGQMGLMRTPAEKRSPTGSLSVEPVITRMDVTLARKALVLAQNEPLRRFPQLGPVEIV